MGARPPRSRAQALPAPRSRRAPAACARGACATTCCRCRRRPAAASRAGRPAFETVTLHAAARPRWWRCPSSAAGRLVEVVQVGIPLAPTERTLQRWLEALLVLVPLGVGLAAAGGRVMARAALRPVDEMSRAARRIDAEELARRITVRGTGDELDRLAETLNGMLAPAGERVRRDAPLLRRRRPRAAHAADRAQGHARGRAARRPLGRRVSRARSPPRWRRSSAWCGWPRICCCSRARPPAPSRPGRAWSWSRSCSTSLEVGARLAKDRGVTVRVGSLAPLAVLGDAGALRRALLNLVENGVKYTPAGGRVELSLAARRGRGRDRRGGHRASASIPPTSSASSSRSCVWTPPAPARAGAAGSAWPSPAPSSSAHRGTLDVERPAAGGSRFTIRLPLAS